MFLNMLKQSEMEEGDEGDGVDVYEKQRKSSLQDIGSIKKKIKFVGKMYKMHNRLTKERDDILMIKNYNENKLPKGLLSQGKSVLEAFYEIKKMDSLREMRPKFTRGKPVKVTNTNGRRVVESMVDIRTKADTMINDRRELESEVGIRRNTDKIFGKGKVVSSVATKKKEPVKVNIFDRKKEPVKNNIFDYL